MTSWHLIFLKKTWGGGLFKHCVFWDTLKKRLVRKLLLRAYDLVCDLFWKKIIHKSYRGGWTLIVHPMSIKIKLPELLSIYKVHSTQKSYTTYLYARILMSSFRWFFNFQLYIYIYRMMMYNIYARLKSRKLLKVSNRWEKIHRKSWIKRVFFNSNIIRQGLS